MADQETLQPAQQVVQMAQSVTIQPTPEFRPDAKVGASLATSTSIDGITGKQILKCS
jgi:hypothetical protein